jgi:hypothetical protein
MMQAAEDGLTDDVARNSRLKRPRLRRILG